MAKFCVQCGTGLGTVASSAAPGTTPIVKNPRERFACPYCQTSVSFWKLRVGKNICPSCGKEFNVSLSWKKFLLWLLVASFASSLVANIIGIKNILIFPFGLAISYYLSLKMNNFTSSTPGSVSQVGQSSMSETVSVKSVIIAGVIGGVIFGPIGAIVAAFIWKGGWPAEKKKKILLVLGLIALVLDLFFAISIFLGAVNVAKQKADPEPTLVKSQSSRTQPGFGTINSSASPSGVTAGITIPPEYQLDTNNDGIPDFVEKQTDYDWRKDECLEKIGACAAPYLQSGGTKQKPKNIVILFDASGSMGEVVNGVAKITAAKEALKNFANQVSSDVNVHLIAFGHKGSNSSADKNVSCNGVEDLYRLSPMDKPVFISTVDQLVSRGWTALTTAMGYAQVRLIPHSGEANEVILLTDGQETCGGDPLGAARSLKEMGAKTVVDVIAFAVSPADRQQLAKIAEAGGGEYKDVTSQSEIEDLFRKHSSTMAITFYRACSASQFNEYAACSIWRVNNALGKVNALQAEAGYTTVEGKVLEQVKQQIGSDVDQKRKDLYQILVTDVAKQNPIPN